MEARWPLWLVVALVVACVFFFVLVAAGGLLTPPKASENRILIGAEEPVELSTEGHKEPFEALADVDTGAYYSSMNHDLADKLGIDLDRAKIVTVGTAIGDDQRPLVPVRIKIADKTMTTQATVSERDRLGEKVVLGRRDLGGFLIDPSRERLTSPRSAAK